MPAPHMVPVPRQAAAIWRVAMAYSDPRSSKTEQVGWAGVDRPIQPAVKP